MAHSARVRIDIAKLAANLKSEDGTPSTILEAMAFLSENGFFLLPSGEWCCEEICLRLLNESEISGGG